MNAWTKDPGIAELIEYFNQQDVVSGGWERLANKPEELRVVMQEVQKCRNDFNYAARNYFHIQTKDRRIIPFKLWDSQELLLEKVNEMKAQGKAQKIIILKARQLGFCVDSKGLILTSDLKWVPAEDVHPGQEVVATDENSAGGRGRGRKMRTATVVAKREILSTAFKLVMSDGRVIIATGEHRFLCRRRGGTEAVWMHVGIKPGTAKSMSPLQVGDSIRYITKPWDHPGETREDGWFGGMLDGEGSFRIRPIGGAEACVAQVAGPVLDRAEKYLKERGYTYHVDADMRKSKDSSKLGDCPVYKLVVNRMSELFRLMGQTRPTRFIDRRWWEGCDLPGKRTGESWAQVVSIEPLPERRMIDIQTTTGTFIYEGFVSHNSTLIEAMMAWRVFFFENVSALIVSHAPHHSVTLFDKLCLILDSLPWYLQPMCLSRKIEEGLKMDNPNHDERALRPGLKSSVVVQAANQLTGVGQGYTIQACHASEIADWEDSAAKQILEADLQFALAEGPETFAFLETTAKGSGRYFHKMWEKNVELAAEAEWEPQFYPWFFEKNRKVIDLAAGFHLEDPEVRMREKVANLWLRCDNTVCGRFRESMYHNLNITGTQCPVCDLGVLQPYELSDNQLAWMMRKRLNAAKDLESLKEYHQELPATAEEAFQLSGVQVFPYDAMTWVQDTIDRCHPKARGFLDNTGAFHGVSHTTGRCPIEECDVDHQWDDMPLTIWEYPEKDAVYTIGVDVAEGLGGDGDWSVAFVNKVSQFREPDEHVATLRSNTMDPISFSFPVAHLGRWYNEALMSIECNKYDTCFSWVRNQLQYPNLYRWKHIDSTNTNSNKWGWWTNQTSRPRLYQTAIKFLKSHMWVVKSKNFYREMQHFQKDDYEDRRVEHSLGEYDDELIAGMIALYCSHDMDYDNDLGFIPIRRNVQDVNTSMWRMRCMHCHATWGLNDLNNSNAYCPRCQSMHVQGDKNVISVYGNQTEYEELVRDSPEIDQPELDYSEI